MAAAEDSGGGGKAAEGVAAPAGVGGVGGGAEAVETAHSPASDAAAAAAPSTSSSAPDNGSLHRSSTMPGVIKDAEIVTETPGSSNRERSKTERRRQNNPANDPAKQLLDDKISPRKKLKMLNRIATVKDDGTVVVDVPSTLELAPVDVGGEDGYGDVTVEESLDGADIPYRPPMQIVILIVGTRGDVQPFFPIGKHLQDYGHRVRLATHANYKEFILTAGLEFFPLGGDPKLLAEYMVKIKGFLPSGPSEIPIQRKQMKEIIFSLLPACRDPDPDTGIPFKVDAIIANTPAYDETAIKWRHHACAIFVSSTRADATFECLNDLKSLSPKKDLKFLKKFDNLYIFLPVDKEFMDFTGKIIDETTQRRIECNLLKNKSATLKIKDLDKLDGFLGWPWKDIQKRLKKIQKKMKFILYVKKNGQLVEAIKALHLDHVYLLGDT